MPKLFDKEISDDAEDSQASLFPERTDSTAAFARRVATAVPGGNPRRNSGIRPFAHAGANDRAESPLDRGAGPRAGRAGADTHPSQPAALGDDGIRSRSAGDCRGRIVATARGR